MESIFTLTLHGRMTLAEPADRGLHRCEGHVDLGHCGQLDEIFTQAEQALGRAYPAHEGAAAFSPERLTVRDQNGYLVLAGKVDPSHRRIDWILPCLLDEEEKVLAQLNLLLSQSAFDRAWGSVSTEALHALDLNVLKGKLVHKRWRTHVRALLET